MPRSRPGAPEDRVRVQHMLDAARQGMSFVATRTREDLDRDPLLARALMHVVMEIGEAAARTSDAGRQRAPGVPWGQIVAMRHFVVHVYWGVNFDRLWKTATDELPVLVSALEAAVIAWPMPDPGPPRQQEPPGSGYRESAPN